jgi:hypothetical protein
LTWQWQDNLENMNETALARLIERLKILEYEIRKSMTVREDQEEDADPQHRDEAGRCGIAVEGLDTKGELLNAVQTTVRSIQAKAGKAGLT